jgi:hypothetical protein
MCAALGNGRDEGVDCFLDEAFLDTWSDALDASTLQRLIIQTARSATLYTRR